jgi:hypothetical protein
MCVRLDNDHERFNVTYALRLRLVPIMLAILLAIVSLVAGSPRADATPVATSQKVCASTANGANFDVYIPDGPDAGTGLDYNNELVPGECTGWIARGSEVLMDLTDDGANEGLDSYKMGEIGYGFEDCDKFNGVQDPYAVAVEPIAPPLRSDSGINVHFYLTADPDQDINVYCGVTIPPYNPGETPNPTTCSSSTDPAPDPGAPCEQATPDTEVY